MKQYYLFLCLVQVVTANAQGYAGHGRGSDNEPLFYGGNSSWGFYIILLIACILSFLYFFLKEKFGKREWTYWEFRSKKGNKVKTFKYDDVHISALIFDNGDHETHVLMGDDCRHFSDINDIEQSQDLVIRYDNRRYSMVRKREE